MLHAFAERDLPLCHSLVLFLRDRHGLPRLGKQLFTARRAHVHVTFRNPIPSNHWRQEERHDQMVSTESD